MNFVLQLLAIVVLAALPWVIRAVFMTNRGDRTIVLVGLGFVFFALVVAGGWGAGMLPAKGRMIRRSERPFAFYTGVTICALLALGMYAFYIYLLFC